MLRSAEVAITLTATPTIRLSWFDNCAPDVRTPEIPLAQASNLAASFWSPTIPSSSLIRAVNSRLDPG